MARTGWHDGLSVSKKFFSRAGAEGLSLDKSALILGIDCEDPQKMRRMAMWRSLAEYGVNFDIPEVVAKRMQEYVESPALDMPAEQRRDPQGALFTAFVEACMARELNHAEMRIAAGLPDPARFKRWMKQVSEGVALRIPEETREAMSEWLVDNNVDVPEDILVRKEMVGIHEMLTAAGAIPLVIPPEVPVPDVEPASMHSEVPAPLPGRQYAAGLSAEPLSPEKEVAPDHPSPIFFTASELQEPLTSDEGAQFQLSLGF